ncbi:MAG: hypothetical protein EP319_02465 [Deltaproteobacteria bacterium]|nr:MAG: hypothetical protein EP319_02465 [Deltaproteobacteria bacterium]
MKGKLILVPTPIAPELPLEEVARAMISHSLEEFPEKTTIVCEEIKEGRRRWLKWGFPRETIDSFILYNEHNRNDSHDEVISLLLKGHTVFLMSDGGLPAFCDPGRKLVETCHKKKIKVTSTPFPNSISLAVALSGFDHDQFVFEGFLPKSKEDREKRLSSLTGERRTIVMMDTPYRLSKIVSECQSFFPNRDCFLALDLGYPEEELIYAKGSQIPKGLSQQKREFILLVNKI